MIREESTFIFIFCSGGRIIEITLKKHLKIKNKNFLNKMLVLYFQFQKRKGGYSHWAPLFNHR